MLQHVEARAIAALPGLFGGRPAPGTGREPDQRSAWR
jgi:hypothetical protein